MIWGAIAGLLAICIALTGVIAYLATQPRRLHDAVENAEKRARDQAARAAAAELAKMQGDHDAAVMIDNLRDEQGMLIASIEAERKSHAATKARLAVTETQRDDLLESIANSPTQASALALLIRRDLERLREEASASQAVPPPPAPRVVTVEVTKDCAEALPASLANIDPVALWLDPNADGTTTVSAEMSLVLHQVIRYAYATSKACRAIPDPVTPPQ